MNEAVITAAVAVAAVAIVLQAASAIATYKAIQAIRQRIDLLAPKAEAALETAQSSLNQHRQQVSEVAAKAGQVLDLAKSQLERVNGVLVDATTRAKSQLERVDLVLEDSLSRVHQTVTLLHSGVLRPLRQINGVVLGIRAALAQLTGQGRPTVAQATHDDEMFI